MFEKIEPTEDVLEEFDRLSREARATALQRMIDERVEAVSRALAPPDGQVAVETSNTFRVAAYWWDTDLLSNAYRLSLRCELNGKPILVSGVPVAGQLHGDRAAGAVAAMAKMVESMAAKVAEQITQGIADRVVEAVYGAHGPKGDLR